MDLASFGERREENQKEILFSLLFLRLTELTTVPGKLAKVVALEWMPNWWVDPQGCKEAFKDCLTVYCALHSQQNSYLQFLQVMWLQPPKKLQIKCISSRRCDLLLLRGWTVFLNRSLAIRAFLGVGFYPLFVPEQNVKHAMFMLDEYEVDTWPLLQSFLFAILGTAHK